MVFIAIDKHSRKILGYLCRNNHILTYCCSDCDFEFTTAHDLEQHMVIHENLPPEDPLLENGADLDLTVEKETQLKMKYQVTPCSVQLFRFNYDDDFEMMIDNIPPENPMPAMDGVNQENVAPVEEKTPKKRPGPASKVKKHKIGNKDAKKVLKKSTPPPAVCYLCGEKFHSTMAMEKHQSSHLQSTTKSPVFPCNICGKNVKNLKMHLRQHKIKTKAAGAVSNPKGAAKNGFIAAKQVEMGTPNDTKVEEASSSTDAIITIDAIIKSDKESDSTTEPFDIHSASIAASPLHKDSPIIVEEYPVRKILVTNHDSESEPSQSEPSLQTEATQVSDTNGLSLHQQQNDLNKAVESPTKKTLPDKVQCKYCNKPVGISYMKIHVKKYHSIVNEINH